METKAKLWTFQTIREEWNEIWNFAIAVRKCDYAMWLIIWYVTDRVW